MEIEEEDMKEALSGAEDPGRQWGFIRHKLLDMLVIGLCSITVRGEYFDGMALGQSLGLLKPGMPQYSFTSSCRVSWFPLSGNT
jgi:hypothetical protein